MVEGMKYRYMGCSGLKVSVLGYGNMTTGMGSFAGKPDPIELEIEQRHFEITERCIKAGINFFDTAEVYGLGNSEIILGRNLKQGGWDRDELVISTKLSPRGFGIQGLSRKRQRVGLANALKRLQLDYVDVLFIHRFDAQVPLKEKVSTMNEFIEDDKAFYWGTSAFSPEQLTECHLLCDKYGWSHPIVEQCEYNMLQRDEFERDYAPLFEQYGMGTTIWSPLSGGILTGKFDDGKIPENTRYSDKDAAILQHMYNIRVGWRPNNGADMLQGLTKIAQKIGCTQAQLAIAWTLVNKDVSLALFGASNMKQLEDNLEAVKVVDKLDNNILQEIEVLLNNRPTPPLNFRTFTPREPRR